MVDRLYVPSYFSFLFHLVFGVECGGRLCQFLILDCSLTFQPVSQIFVSKEVLYICKLEYFWKQPNHKSAVLKSRGKTDKYKRNNK